MPPSVDDVRALVSTAPEDIVAAYVFGSVARGTASATSDLDVAVLRRAQAAHTLAETLLDYEAALERAAGCPVQLVSLNEAPPDLAFRVLRDGRLVLDRDRSARIRFEVRTRNVYFDLHPILTRYRQRARELAAARS